ncbi:hypothetical protein [Campylobacter troglodytis]|uniref:hypothetical protein n=1 Tax=Campylobacter troglodytis TaxID=654363 RepID=UPI001158953C|nr:hypothetical protein [Campylobacter troglodytis]TQR54798.1 hypothetical protein DMC01_09920 [Campylobacter troglodytis]
MSGLETADKSPCRAKGDLGGGYENPKNLNDDKNSTNALNLKVNSQENSNILQDKGVENLQISQNDNFANAKFDPPPNPLRKGGGLLLSF